MSIVMVGPFPGPFDRTHYSDSSSENPNDARQRRPGAQGFQQRPPPPPPPLEPYLSLLQEQGTPRTSGTPRDSVAYSSVRTDSGAPSPVCACHVLTLYAVLPRSLRDPPLMHAYELLRRLVVVALALIAVAVLVVAVSRSMRVRADAAHVKGGNAAVQAANGTDRKDSTALRATSPTHAAAPAAVGGPRAGSTARPLAEARHYKRRHGGTGHGRKASSQLTSPVSSSSSPSSSSLSPSTNDNVEWPMTEEADREVASGAPTSPAAVFSGEKAAGNDEGNDSGLQGGLVASPDPAASKASTPAGRTTEVGSVAVATTTASTDLPEVINEADARGDLQEV
ncbi:hypothetical protein HPB52_008638 [Rhipicephalus sanguineus]|uniref:Uncharacterized protein n=1 Tax=Rhipicephalus sanguineus TaxID=34632 RepID=A0A9D4QD00_RHISA|nr:hypothetical protein HPB52_008638 [Rhipicephalus sanguineus]